MQLGMLLVKFFWCFRSIAGVRGFSRETIIALAANVVSREWRCEYLAAK